MRLDTAVGIRAGQPRVELVGKVISCYNNAMQTQ